MTRSERHQAARHHVFSVGIHNRQMILGRQLSDRDTLRVDEGVVGMNERLGAPSQSFVKGGTDIFRASHLQRLCLDAHRLGFRAEQRKQRSIGCVAGDDEHGYLVEVRGNSLQDA